MDINTGLAITTLAVLVVCFATSFTLKDNPSRPNASHLVQLMFALAIALILVFALIAIEQSPLLLMLSDILLAVEQAVLLLFFFRRYRAFFSPIFIYVAAFIYFLIDTLAVSFGNNVGYTYIGVVCLISALSIVKYKKCNIADYGLAVTLLLWGVFSFLQLELSAANISFDLWDHNLEMYFVALPALNSAFMIFLATSYMTESREELRELAFNDPLTGVFNRRAFYISIEKVLGNTSRSEKNSSVLITDIDFFKKVNDTYGHEVGDEVIKGFSKVVADSLREGDVIARFGGEEFVAVLVDSSVAQASEVAERIRLQLRDMRFGQQGNVAITASFGVAAVYSPGDIDKDINRADAALILAKEAGRDRVEVNFETSS